MLRKRPKMLTNSNLIMAQCVYEVVDPLAIRIGLSSLCESPISYYFDWSFGAKNRANNLTTHLLLVPNAKKTVKYADELEIKHCIVCV